MIVWNCQKVNSMKHLPRISNRSPPPIIIRVELFSQVGETVTSAKVLQIDRAYLYSCRTAAQEKSLLIELPSQFYRVIKCDCVF